MDNNNIHQAPTTKEMFDEAAAKMRTNQDYKVKYEKLRAAAINMLGVEDNKAALLTVLGELSKQPVSLDDDDTLQAALMMLATLIQTMEPE